MMLRLAMLSLSRHRGRTALSVVAVAVSVTAAILVSSLVDGIEGGFLDQLIGTSGHVRVEAVDEEAEELGTFSVETVISDYRSLRDRVSEHVDEGGIATTLEAEALLLADAGRRNFPVLAVGVGLGEDGNPRGLYRDARESLEESGRFPPGEGEVLVSRRVVELLELDRGDSVVLLAEDVTGSPYHLELEIVDLYHTDDPDFDRTTVFVAHSTVEELIYQIGATRRMPIFLDNRGAAESVAATLGDLVPENVRVRTWREIHESFLVTLELFDVFELMILALMMVVAGGTIANTILMGVFDRAQEFGTMRAIGMKRRSAFRLVIAEGLAISLVGIALATSLTVPALAAVPEGGIYIGEVGVAFGIGERLTPILTAGSYLTAVVTGLAVALIGAAYAGFLLRRAPITTLLRED